MTRILFVDDDQRVLTALQRMLRPLRDEWEVSFASGAEHALALLAAQPFDAVVSDMRMPGMDGAELLARVEQQCPSAARIVLSGYSEPEGMRRAHAVAHETLSKPCDRETLRAVVRRAVAKQSAAGTAP